MVNQIIMFVEYVYKGRRHLANMSVAPTGRAKRQLFSEHVAVKRHEHVVEANAMPADRRGGSAAFWFALGLLVTVAVSFASIYSILTGERIYFYVGLLSFVVWFIAAGVAMWC